MNQTAKKGEESALFECKNLSVNLVSLFALHLMHCPVKALTFLQGCQRKKKRKSRIWSSPIASEIQHREKSNRIAKLLVVFTEGKMSVHL